MFMAGDFLLFEYNILYLFCVLLVSLCCLQFGAIVNNCVITGICKYFSFFLLYIFTLGIDSYFFLNFSLFLETDFYLIVV